MRRTMLQPSPPPPQPRWRSASSPRAPGPAGRAVAGCPTRSTRCARAAATKLTASDLRNTLNQLLGEHAVLAMNATNLGVKGSKAFPAAAKALDRNSVELSQAIGSIYGARRERRSSTALSCGAPT